MDETTKQGTNERIAKLLGWRVEKQRSGYWWLIRGDDTIIFKSALDERGAWSHAPDYEHDLNAVAAALPDGWGLEIWTTPDGKPAAMVRRGTKCFYGRDASTYQDAAARALLALLEAAPTSSADGA